MPCLSQMKTEHVGSLEWPDMPVGSLKAGRGYPSGAFRPDVDEARNGKPVEAAQSFSPVGTPKMADERKFASRSSGPGALTRSRRGERVDLSGRSGKMDLSRTRKWNLCRTGGESLDFGV